MEENVAQQEAVQEQPEASYEQQETAQNNSEESIQEVNLRKLRQAKEEAERRAVENEQRMLALEKQLEEMRNAVAPKPVQVSAKSESFLADEDLVEGRDFNKMYGKMDEFNKKLQEMERVNQEAIADARIKAEYPDYRKVVTQENINKFVKLYPELASSLEANKDIYLQSKSLYQSLKQFGIYQEDKGVAAKDAINKNIIKPMPSNSLGGKSSASPISQANLFANGLTEDVKKELRRQNEEARKRF